jgi:hypothetical protein
MSGDRKPDPEPDGHPSADTTQRHRADQALRAVGFEIVARPQYGPNRWRRRKQGEPGWDYFTEGDAHEFRSDLIAAAAGLTRRGRRK